MTDLILPKSKENSNILEAKLPYLNNMQPHTKNNGNQTNRETCRRRKPSDILHYV